MIPFFRKLDWLFQRGRKEDELREELDFHLSEETGQGVGAGLPEEAARSAARRELGNLGLIQEDTRSTWGWSLLDQLAQDMRYAFRTMKSNQLFSLLAVLTLALGIGANTAIYSFLDAILVRELPVADPQSLIVLKWHTKTQHDSVMHGMSTGASSDTYDDPQTGTIGGIFPYPAFELVQKQDNDSVFSSIFAFESAFADSLNISIKGEPGLQPGVFVSCAEHVR
jgi:macrolide transport system ATP-binding/permease protein